MYIHIYICGVGSSDSLKKFITISLDGTHDETQKDTNYQSGAAAGLNQSARANQPSKLCDHQPTADSLEHLCPGTTKQPPPTPPQNMTETDIYEEVYMNFLSKAKIE